MEFGTWLHCYILLKILTFFPNRYKAARLFEKRNYLLYFTNDYMDTVRYVVAWFPFYHTSIRKRNQLQHII